jgi:hypothetical protein
MGIYKSDIGVSILAPGIAWKTGKEKYTPRRYVSNETIYSEKNCVLRQIPHGVQTPKKILNSCAGAFHHATPKKGGMIFFISTRVPPAKDKEFLQHQVCGIYFLNINTVKQCHGLCINHRF